jgi:hypothetical protein
MAGWFREPRTAVTVGDWCGFSYRGLNELAKPAHPFGWPRVDDARTGMAVLTITARYVNRIDTKSTFTFANA